MPRRPSPARSALRRTVRPATLALSLVAALALPACAARQGADGEPSERVEQAPTTLAVRNQNFSDMTIYVLRGSQRIRLGIAGGSSETRFRIPDNLIFGIATLQFLADPIGSSRTPVSQEIRVTAGDVITLTIPPGM